MHAHTNKRRTHKDEMLIACFLSHQHAVWHTLSTACGKARQIPAKTEKQSSLAYPQLVEPNVLEDQHVVLEVCQLLPRLQLQLHGVQPVHHAGGPAAASQSGGLKLAAALAAAGAHRARWLAAAR